MNLDQRKSFLNCHYLLAWLVFLPSISTGSAFNIDLQSPTIVNSGVTDGEAIAFGFSLAQHALGNGSMR